MKHLQKFEKYNPDEYAMASEPYLSDKEMERELSSTWTGDFYKRFIDILPVKQWGIIDNNVGTDEYEELERVVKTVPSKVWTGPYSKRLATRISRVNNIEELISCLKSVSIK